MTDTDKLKRLAEALKGNGHVLPFGVRPEEILDLIAENEALTTGGIIEVAVRNPSVADYVQHWGGRAERAEKQRDDAVELLRESSVMHKDMHEVIAGFLARIDAAE